jgi:hypothetical protein
MLSGIDLLTRGVPFGQWCRLATNLVYIQGGRYVMKSAAEAGLSKNDAISRLQRTIYDRVNALSDNDILVIENA